jgi:isopenicillin N synthase-like dioxygenase
LRAISIIPLVILPTFTHKHKQSLYHQTNSTAHRLAKQLEHAVHHVGFFYVKNYGITTEAVDHQFTLAKNFFALPVSIKSQSEVDYANADYNGWRRPGLRQLNNVVRDNVEMYNFAKFTQDFEGKYHHPDLIKAHLDEIETFHKALHANVVLPLLRLFAIVLKLPDEEYLVKQHTYEKRSEDHLRYMIYHKRTPEEHEASGFGQSSGHTDLGTVTLLFRQPVARLQILGEDGNWTYVSAQPGTITVNLADTISHITGGYLKSSVHRVVAPPKDQWNYDRTGLLYFARPHSDTILVPIEDSPVLQAAGVKSRFDKPISMARLPFPYKQILPFSSPSTLFVAGSRNRSLFCNFWGGTNGGKKGTDE